MAPHATVRSRSRFVAVLALAVVVVSCTSADDSAPLPAIVNDGEEGPRLTIEGRVVDDATGMAIEGARIDVYQTDQAGTYQPEDPADESTARIRGAFITDSDGAFGFVTVQPGEYPGQPPGNRHIHFHTVAAAGYAADGFVLLFDGNVRAEVRAWAETTGFGRVITLVGSANSELRGYVEIRLTPNPA